jgi:hypothetical protein
MVGETSRLRSSRNWRMNLTGIQSGARLVIAMYRNEGTLRIRVLSKRLMLFGSLAGMALWVLMFTLNGGGSLPELFILIAGPLACGGTLWLVAWIVEGFMISSGHE